MQTIDFSPLGSMGAPGTGRIRIPEIGIFKKIGIGALFIIVVPVLFIALAIIGLIFSIIPDIVWIIGFLGFFSWAGFKIVKIQSKEKAKIAAFIAANGWQAEAQPPTNPVLNQLGYSIGAVKMAGTLDSMPFWIHQITDKGRNGSSSTNHEVLAIQVPRPLPTMMLLPPLGAITQHIGMAFGLERVQFEGDFDRYVNVYAEPNKQIDLLSYITPDVMRVLTDDTSSMVMYAGNFVYIMAAMGAGLQSNVLQLVFEDGQKILKEILEKQT